MTERKIIATERIDKKMYRLVLIPASCLALFVILIMGYGWAIVYDDLYDITHWLS